MSWFMIFRLGLVQACLGAVAGRRLLGVSFGSLRSWMLGGCLASALALVGLVVGSVFGRGWLLRANVFVLGVANGAFSIAAIGSMMALAGQGRATREGTRVGLWGAAQAIGFAVGGVLCTAASDLARLLIGLPGSCLPARVRSRGPVVHHVGLACQTHPHARRGPRHVSPCFGEAS